MGTQVHTQLCLAVGTHRCIYTYTQVYEFIHICVSRWAHTHTHTGEHAGEHTGAYIHTRVNTQLCHIQ